MNLEDLENLESSKNHKNFENPKELDLENLEVPEKVEDLKS